MPAHLSFSVTSSCRLSGLSQTLSIVSQLRVGRFLQRAGLACLAAFIYGRCGSQKYPGPDSMTAAPGVTKRIPRWCRWLAVIPVHEALHPRPGLADVREALMQGYAGLYFQGLEHRLRVRVVNRSPMERLNEGTTPSFARVASMVARFIGLPIIECSTTDHGGCGWA